MSVFLPEFCGRHSKSFTEAFGKVVGIIEAHRHRNISYGIVGFSQQVCTLFKPHHSQILVQRDTGFFSKNFVEVIINITVKDYANQSKLTVLFGRYDNNFLPK